MGETGAEDRGRKEKREGETTENPRAAKQLEFRDRKSSNMWQALRLTHLHSVSHGTGHRFPVDTEGKE